MPRNKPSRARSKRGGPREKGRRSRRSIVLAAASALVLASLFWLVHELSRAPAQHEAAPGDRRETDPLTDVAPRRRGSASRAVPSLDPAAVRARARADGQSVAPEAPYVLPEDMADPANPPQWTEPRATPGTPSPPDPHTPPEIEQDPDRARRVEQDRSR